MCFFFIIHFSRFQLEGYGMWCSFDYLTDTPSNRSFVVFLNVVMYVLPMAFIIFFYSQVIYTITITCLLNLNFDFFQIVSAVSNHERALREQAKKMNVESLRANQVSEKKSYYVGEYHPRITECFRSK